MAINVQGVQQALTACARQDATLIFISTSGVYAPLDVHALREDDPIEPPRAYGESKYIGERLCRAWWTEQSVPVKILRLFNVYGAYQSADLLPGYVLQQAVSGEPIALKTPQAQRDFLHADDAARAILSACAQSWEGFDLFNVGEGVSRSVAEFVETLERVMGRALPQERQPADDANEQDEVSQFRADITRIHNALGWSPSLDLEAGLRRTLQQMGVETVEESEEAD
ncbi:putative NAD-dependent epimerase/dehydratase [Magnetofaba australis IT-1]|uniref:Putative NAD-dependent epimerase/dehydratase n=2 Tax=Magnetofaba TaxID=1472292 RepID=A0A1Y2JYY7_9PROT|nr:putative NAD-dependent epimerase/dehydratase [Magnetofaba australis IT-1]